MPALLAYSDIQFIFMSPDTEKHGFPSKVYTIMACAKPLLVISGDNTPIINFLKDKDCAYLFTERNSKTNSVRMADLLRNSSLSEFERMGKNGYMNIENFYSKEKVTDEYVKLVEGLVK
jgi:colanic acid biosynthesis glycosyl transferase WcaI